MDLTRAMGTILFKEGVILRAYPLEENRTEIELAPNIRIGAIVRDPETGRWRYDDALRTALGIVKAPEFTTDCEAAESLEEFIPSLSAAQRISPN